MTLKMDPKSMPNPTKGGEGPPKERPGWDFDSFWCASRGARGPKRGVLKMDLKMGPQKNRKIRFKNGLLGGQAGCADPIWLFISKIPEIP